MEDFKPLLFCVVSNTENKAIRAELEQLKRDKTIFEKKAHVIQRENVALRANLSNLLIVVAQLQNQTHSNSVRLNRHLHIKGVGSVVFPKVAVSQLGVAVEANQDPSSDNRAPLQLLGQSLGSPWHL
eukprot:SAG31_NODE_180_length_21118_cov_62.152671_3_plen_127_part_00